MRIKEVENQTGLTAKAIRLYESKGLLTVERHAGNDYRDYSEEDVKRLKTIAVLRKLDVPISDIKRWSDGEVELTELLQRVTLSAQSEARKANVRKRLAETLEDVLQQAPEQPLDEAIAQAEGVEQLLQELEADVGKVRDGCFWPTLLTLGTMGWFGDAIRDILAGKLLEGLGSILLCCVGVPLLVTAWKELVKRRFWQDINWKRGLSFLLLTALGLALMCGSFALLIWCQLHLLHPHARGFYNSIFWVVAGVYPLVVVYHWNAVRRWRILAAHMGAYLLLAYVAVTWATAFAGGSYVRYVPFAPQNPEVYTLEMAQGVETGFAESGDFYYEVTFEDGWKLDAAASDLYAEGDPWQDLLVLDCTLMELGVEKKIDDTYRDRFNLNEECQAICDEILTNTG